MKFDFNGGRVFEEKRAEYLSTYVVANEANSAEGKISSFVTFAKMDEPAFIGVRVVKDYSLKKSRCDKSNL